MKEILNSLGIEVFGVCDFSEISDGLIPCRALSRLPEKPESVITALFPYNLGEYGERSISRYACVADYHEVTVGALKTACELLEKKYEGSRFVTFVDNSPVPEVRAAALSGLGCIGENSLLINEKFGSWVFIGSIVTDRHFEKTGGEIKKCPSCGKCRSACPNGELDKSRCLSAITQKKGELTENEQGLMLRYNTAWGCDICQEVCPLNKNAAVAPFPGFLKFPVVGFLEAENDNMRAYNYRGRKTVERNIKILNG